jgi:hypothetical protein
VLTVSEYSSRLLIGALRAAACLSVLFLWGAGTKGMEPEVRRAIRPGTELLIELNHPTRLLECQFSQDLWRILNESRAVRRLLECRDADRLRQSARFLETSLGVDWQTALLRLTEGGVVIAVHPAKSGKQPDVTVIVSSDSEQTLNRVLEAVHDTLRRRAPRAAPTGDAIRPAAVLLPEPAPTTFRAFSCHRVGKGFYAVVGRRLLVANRQEALEESLERLSDPEVAGQFQPPEPLQFAETAGQEPLVLITLNLKQVRQNPGTLEKLCFPTADWRATLLAGGYLDLVRRADYAAAGLFVDDRGAELRVRLPAGAEGAFAGLDGYFAARAGESAERLLRLPRTMLSLSWFRDYSRLWNTRSALFVPRLVEQLDSEDIRQRSSGAGPGWGELSQVLGSHFRIVVARQRESAYPSPPVERLPAFALVVDVRDERKFREHALASFDRLVQVSAASLAGQIGAAEYRGVKLTTVRFDDPQNASPRERRRLLNFDPAYALRGEHLIVGSTSEIVRDVIDDLARQSEIPAAAPTDRRPTHEFQCSFTELADSLNLFRETFVRQFVSDRKLTNAEAGKEFDVLRRFLSQLGTVSSWSVLGPRQFDFVLRIGAEREEPAAPARSPAIAPPNR